MTVIYFIFILGSIIFIHELGHFIFSKIFDVYVYEFSLGMGPRLLKFQPKKSETEYSIRLFPIGGYVRIAGEDEPEDDKIPDDRKLNKKSWIQRFIVMGAGSLFNLVFAFIILFILAITMGSISSKPIIGDVMVGYPAYTSGLTKGDLVLSIDGAKVNSYDELVVMLYKNGEKTAVFEVKKANNQIEFYTIKPIEDKGMYVFGIRPSIEKNYGLINSIKNTNSKFMALISTMGASLASLLTGGLSINQFSGPVGVYDMVGDQVASGIADVAYFIAFLSINIGFINMLPFPALDGGKIFFLIIEGIKGSQVNPKFENAVHLVGFLLLIALMLVVTFNDIFRLGGI